MDARSLRSRSQLRAAILQLSTATPIDDISVAAICRESGITRDTFYRHADTPAHLLADALAHEIDAAMEALPTAQTIGDGEHLLIAHVAARADIYRGAMRPTLVAPVRSALEQSVRHGLETWIALRPAILPPALRDDAIGQRIATAYAASGTVGAIEAWLDSGADENERAVELILAASPEWWLR